MKSKKNVDYKKSDKAKYTKLNKTMSNSYKIELLDIVYDIHKTKNLELPNKLFSRILVEKRPDLVKYCPFKIIVKKLERGNNVWLKKAKKLGIYNENNKELTLSLDIKIKHSVLSFLWLLFHEFRHHIQFSNPNILSCLDNQNRKMWLEYYDKNLSSVKHVFHEVDPLEVDANTFACEMLNIPYPNSKFSITKETLKRLRDE